MSVKRLRALLVGLGQIGCGYDADLPFHWDQPHSSPRTLSHARALACHPGYELIGGVDPNLTARERFSRVYRLPVYASLPAYRAACVDPDPDLVVIAVAPQLQPGLVDLLLALMKPRLLLLEKPVAVTPEQAKVLRHSCARQPDLLVAVNYIRRYLPAVQAWQQRLQAGELGRFLHGQLTYGKGLLSNGSHFVNLAEAWLGPLAAGRLLDSGPVCQFFDRETSLELVATDHGDAPLVVRSVGAAGLRAGELDLWFEGGRVCWFNDGSVIGHWSASCIAPGDSHVALASTPALISTGMTHYQMAVAESIYKNLAGSGESPLRCSLNDGTDTLELLTSAFTDVS